MATEGLIPLGWREWVTFPDFADACIKAKVDTGARTSALHATDLCCQDGPNPTVSFTTFCEGVAHKREPVRLTAPLLETRDIKSSNGGIEHRPVIGTHITIGGKTWPIELTLTDRHKMKFQLLLGREAMKGRAMVVPGQSFLAGPKPIS